MPPMSPDTSPPRALILIAAELEAEVLFGSAGARPAGLEICVAGVGTSGDAAAEKAIAATTADIVVNAGFAGGLTDATRPGHCFTVTEWIGCDPSPRPCALPSPLADRLERLKVLPAKAITVDQPAGDPEERLRLAAAGAELVEMEGARWAAAAARHDLPFLSLRVVSDNADNALPLPRHELMNADGDVHWARWLHAAAGTDYSLPDGLRRLREAHRDWRVACGRLGMLGAALSAWQEASQESSGQD